jgi:hypothetical protein
MNHFVHILEEAREHLEHTPWTKKTLHKRDENGRIIASDAMGAIELAARHAIERGEAKEPYAFVVYKSASFVEKAAGVQHLPRWNDMDERRFEDVLDAFGRAIEIAKKSVS